MCEKMIDPLVVKDFWGRGLPIFKDKGGKKTPLPGAGGLQICSICTLIVFRVDMKQIPSNVSFEHPKNRNLGLVFGPKGLEVLRASSSPFLTAVQTTN